MTANQSSNNIQSESSIFDSNSVANLSKTNRRRIVKLINDNKNAIIHKWSNNQFNSTLIKRYSIVGVSSLDTMAQSYITPLLDLLIAAIKTSERRYSDIYLDERLRYAPHHADPGIVADFFSEILPADEAAILEVIKDDSKTEICRALLAYLHQPLREFQKKEAIRLLAVGDCLLNELRVFLPSRMRNSKTGLDMRCLYFSAVVGRSLSTDQVLQFIESSSPHIIAFSFLSYEALPLYSALLHEADKLSTNEITSRITSIVGIIREFINQIRENTDATFLIHNVSGLPLTRLRRFIPVSPLSSKRRQAIEMINQSLSELCAHSPNTILLDEHAVAVKRGYRACSRSVIPSSITKRAAFHTSWFGEFLTSPYEDILNSFRDLRLAKVIFVDFDNTLWEGVMADGKVTHFLEKQRLLRTLKDAGILLVALSKNTPENIRWDEMILAPSDFVLLKINWDLKAKSIASAAQELDLGLNSFVLIDDNPVERELVKNELPSVQTMDANNPYTWRSLERLLEFPNTRSTNEAKNRTAMYREQAQRREAQNQEFDYPTMMASLELKASFGHAKAKDLDRVTELIQRTNQFNTTTIRYSRTDIQQFLESPIHQVYVAELSDKFGKLGIVGVVIVSLNQDEATIDSFVMSCRAMGFGLEQLMLSRILTQGDRQTAFIGKYIQTDRNTPAMGLYQENGFQRKDDTTWRLEPSDPRPKPPDWFQVTERS